MTEASAHTATCCCGALSATVTGEPTAVSMCSCQMCQRRSGSAFALSTYWPAEAVTIEGESQRWARTAAKGRVFEQFFCPTCGTTVWYRGQHRPDMIGIAGGCFADPDLFQPTAAVWDTTRHKWLDDLDKLPRLPEQRT